MTTLGDGYHIRVGATPLPILLSIEIQEDASVMQGFRNLIHKPCHIQY
jgi:hypothetical protein